MAENAQLETTNPGQDHRPEDAAITALLALLALAAAVLASNKISGIPSKLMGVSIPVIAIAAFLMAWHKFREPIRRKLLKQAMDRVASKYSKMISEYVEEVSVPLAVAEARVQYSERLIELKQNGTKVTKEIMLNDPVIKQITEQGGGSSDRHATVIKNFVDNLAHESAMLRRHYRGHPLNERYAKSRKLMDASARKFRFHVAAAGAIMFLVAFAWQFFVS